MGKSSVRWWVFTIGILAVAMTVAVLGVGIVGLGTTHYCMPQPHTASPQ